ncbi:MAG: UbiA family prenyltransferase [Nostoc sp. ChiSLP01]|nr:UbiA family prenyltransferase [Nostoc sp. CmiSLP01]MDZ8285879.1 UbiA family prenyltransferase [Nostoc sp. ChiSLP01]
MDAQTKVVSSNFAAINLSKSLLRELNLLWQFTGRDISSTIIPPILFIVAAWHYVQSSLSEFLFALPCGTLFVWLYLFSFCLSNQIAGVEEDRINKPNRPLVTGKISLHGALVRWFLSMALFTFVGWYFGVLEWALICQMVVILHNFGGWDKHWVTKNFLIGLGTFAHLAAVWQLMTPITPIAWRWLFLIGAIWSTLVAVQDLRDIEGDLAVNRSTFPIAFGEKASRFLLSLGFGLLPFIIHFILMMPTQSTASTLLCDVVLAVFSWFIAARIVFNRSPQEDHQTYMLFTYWYCLVLGSAIVVL